MEMITKRIPNTTHAKHINHNGNSIDLAKNFTLRELHGFAGSSCSSVIMFVNVRCCKSTQGIIHCADTPTSYPKFRNLSCPPHCPNAGNSECPSPHMPQRRPNVLRCCLVKLSEWVASEFNQFMIILDETHILFEKMCMDSKQTQTVVYISMQAQARSGLGPEPS